MSPTHVGCTQQALPTLRTSPLPSAAAAASTGMDIAYLLSHSGCAVMSRTSSSAALQGRKGGVVGPSGEGWENSGSVGRSEARWESLGVQVTAALGRAQIQISQEEERKVKGLRSA